jgi:hypothetical protein
LRLGQCLWLTQSRAWFGSVRWRRAWTRSNKESRHQPRTRIGRPICFSRREAASRALMDAIASSDRLNLLDASGKQLAVFGARIQRSQASTSLRSPSRGSTHKSSRVAPGAMTVWWPAAARQRSTKGLEYYSQTARVDLVALAAFFAVAEERSFTRVTVSAATVAADVPFGAPSVEFVCPRAGC